MQVYRILAVIAALGLFVFGCGTKQDPASTDGDIDFECISYDTVVKTILDDNCIRCHGSFGSYSGAVAKAERANSHIQDGSMPPGGGLGENSRAIFQQWLDDGTPETCTASDGDSDNVESFDPEMACVDYADTMSVIFNNWCAKCHATTLSGGERSRAPEEINYDTFDEAKRWASKGYHSVAENEMPPGEALPATERTLMKRWIDEDYTETCQEAE